MSTLDRMRVVDGSGNFLGYYGQLPPRQQRQSPLTALLNQYRDAYTSAREANERRYHEILAEGAKMGGQERADIASQTARQTALMQQQLASRGLAGTTIGASLRRGLLREQTDATGRLDERLRQWRLGFMERRNDTYPDFNMLTSLAQLYGQGGGR